MRRHGFHASFYRVHKEGITNSRTPLRLAYYGTPHVRGMLMRKKQILLRSCLIGLLCLVFPLTLAIVLAQRSGQQQAISSLATASDEITRRSSSTKQQLLTAITALTEGASTVSPCSSSDMNRMRSLAAADDYLQGIGVISGNTLRCSTLTGLVQTSSLGEPTVTTSGLYAWNGQTLPDIPGKTFNLIGRDGYVAIILPELVLDIRESFAHFSFVQLQSSNSTIIRAHGFYDPRWLTHTREEETFRAGDWLIHVRPNRFTDSVVFVAMPHADVQALTWKAMRTYVSVGLAVGLALLTVVCFFTRELLSMRAQIRDALRDKAFYMNYQPVMDLQTGRCVGAEALIRWKDSDGKPVSPLVFIPAAEECGLIREVTVQVMEMVAQEAVGLIRNYPEAHIAINFSPDDLHSAEIETHLKELWQRIGASSNIVIEATERGLLFPEKVTPRLISVRAQGFRVGIDDFGTGSSSLSYLATYDLDFLKIDKVFVDALGNDGSTSKVAFHIIGLAKTLGLQMVAEGVETDTQRKILRDAGVQYAQGWVFGKPMPMADLAQFMHVANASAA